MYKKILVLFLLSGWIIGPYAKAAFSFPYFNITVNENTIGGDGNFSFHIQAFNPSLYFSKDFSIQTTSGIGSNFTGGRASNGDIYYITQDSLAGWNNASITCASSNSSISISYVENVAIISAYPYSSITCNFTNTKQNSKTPVLIIPGVLGTDLNKGSEKLWLDLGHNFTDVGDQFMDPLQFQPDLNPIDNSLFIGEVVRKPSILFDYTDGLIQEFQNQGYTQGTASSDNLFLFPYDWRYGVSGIISGTSSTTVDLLQQKIQDIRVQTGSDKVDVVAHSTGGLLVKQYAMNHPADNHIGKAVFLGVPNTGAPKAIKTLLEGDSFGIPWLADSEMQKISKNLPIVYDLMPSGKYYVEKFGPVKIFQGGFFTSSEKELNYDETNAYLAGPKNLNSQAISNAKNLHTVAYDNFDLRTAGVDLYSIVGCKAGTISQVLDFQKPDGAHVRYDLASDTPGDGTVPLESATNLPIDQDHKYYALVAEHGKMPSQDGIRQQIVNIISGSHLSTQSSILHSDLITNDISKCKLKGKAISVYSPLDIDITDQNGNHAGLVAGGIQNDIPNADFEIMGEHKFVYLPDGEGQTYTVNIKGTGNGTFTIKDQDISDNQIQQTQVFSNLPVTPALTGQVNLGSTATLSLDSNGDGAIDQTIQPSSVINANQSQDLTPPVSTSTVTGLMGQSGFYRSDVYVTLSATDPVLNNDPSQTSGVLQTNYNLDGAGYQAYSSTRPIIVAAEGSHSLAFYSTDRAGNNEPEQTLIFTIDKTPPELISEFDPKIQDLQFTATDTLPTIIATSTLPSAIKPPKDFLSRAPKAKIVDSGDVITATDAAGNQTVLALQDKDRKHSLRAEIKSLSYNGKKVDLSKNVLKFQWQLDKQGNLKSLSQSVKSKKDFNIEAEFNATKNQTKLEGRDQTGKINKTLAGLILLKVTTDQGDLNWSY